MVWLLLKRVAEIEAGGAIAEAETSASEAGGATDR